MGVPNTVNPVLEEVDHVEQNHVLQQGIVGDLFEIIRKAKAILEIFL